MELFIKLMSAVLVALPAFFGFPVAEEQLGTSSRASSRISIEIAPRVEPVKTVQRRRTPGGALCLQTNTDSDAYAFHFQPAGESYRVQNGSPYTIGYDIMLNRAVVTSRSGRAYPRRASQGTCEGGLELGVRFNGDQIRRAPAGSYEGTLFLAVEPI